MLKSIIISFAICFPFIGFGQDSSKVSVDTFDWDTTGLYYFMNSDSHPYDYSEEKTAISDSLMSVILERLPVSMELELRDTLNEPVLLMEYVFYLRTGDDGYYSIPSKLDLWTYQTFNEMFLELVYLRISSGVDFSCISIDVVTESDFIWYDDLYWKVFVRVDLE